MNLRQLEQFVAIVEQGSFQAAAVSLGITQPALTKSITSLEEEFGVMLLTRSRGRAATLTAFGRVTYERGLRILEEVQDTRQSIELMRDGYAGVVRIGFGAAMGSSTIAQISSELRRHIPTSMIHVRTGLQHELLPKLRTGQLDFLIISGLSQISKNDLVLNNLWRDPFRVFMSPDHPMADTEIYDPEWAIRYPWLSSQRLVSTDDKATRFLGHDHVTGAPQGYDVYDPAIIAQILTKGDYLSAWPSKSFYSEEKLGLLRSVLIPFVDGEQWTSTTHLVYRRGIPMTTAVQAAWRIIQKMDLT